MAEHKIDFENWQRRELFQHFSLTSSPFWAVTYEEDVTEILDFARKHHVSFYHMMIWTAAKALNSVPAFRCAIRKDGIYELDERLPSFTSMKKDSETFQIITMPFLGEFPLSFCRRAEELAENQKEFIRYDLESDALIFVSCLPWINVTGLRNEGISDPDDSVPRIAWGRFEKKDGRYILGMSFEVNHRLIDGFHIGQFHESFRRIAASLSVQAI